MRVIIIGDVHGCLEELTELIDVLKLQWGEDSLVFVGDLVDKGPDSVGVLNYVYKLSLSHPYVMVLQGNHEEKHCRWLKHFYAKNGREKRLKDHEKIAEIQNQLSEGVKGWLFTHGVWTSVNTGPRSRGIVVHAGIPKDMPRLPDGPWAGQSREDMKYGERMLRIRHVHPETGEFVGRDQRKGNEVFWTHHYDGRFGTVFYGHHAYVTRDTPLIHNDTVGLDLGCVYGNLLCAVVIDSVTGNREFVTVKAKKAYAPFFDDPFVE